MATSVTHGRLLTLHTGTELWWWGGYRSMLHVFYCNYIAPFGSKSGGTVVKRPLKEVVPWPHDPENIMICWMS
jgi:hypothetical protein